MLVSTEGIVLHSIKYGESSLIATIYTRESGRQSYLINSARGKKSKNRAGSLQPLFLVELVAYQKQTRELNRLKEFKIAAVYQNLSQDIIKSTLAIFLAEMLYKTIHEHESYPEMFDFIKNSLLFFDLMDEGASNFHLWFLLRLTEYLGFMPDFTATSYKNWFDLKKGAVQHFEPAHPFFANPEVTETIVALSKIKLHELEGFEIHRKMRDEILTVLMDYYRLQLEELGEVKSLNVLREVFQ